MKTTDTCAAPEGQAIPVTETSWKDTALVALDLEGSGAQDRENEDILEIATVPIAGGRPAVGDAYATVINPGRPLPRRRWISPGLTADVLARPSMDAVTPELDVSLARLCHLAGYPGDGNHQSTATRQPRPQQASFLDL